MIMNHRQALQRLKYLRQRTKNVLDQQALDFAISEMEDWMVGQEEHVIRHAKRKV